MMMMMLVASGLSPDFLRMSVTAASLNVWGTKPDLQEELISVMSEETAGRQSLKRLDGMVSTVQVVLFVPMKLDSSMGGKKGEN